MTRAAGLIAILLVLSAPPIHAREGEKVLVLPFRTIGVEDATAAAVRTVLSGELEARGYRVVGGEAALPASAAEACDEPECALLQAERAEADRVVYGTLSRLGGKTSIRVHALRVGSEAPYFRDQITAPTDADLPDLLGRIANAIDADRVSARPNEIPRLRMDAPRLALAGGILLPISDGYAEQTRLTSLRLYLRRQRDDVFFEMGIPFGGIAWSGDLGWASHGEPRAIDWTLYDIFVGRRFRTAERPAHIGLGLGLHRLDFTHGRYVYPAWKTSSVSCGDCGNGSDGIVVTGEAGVGTRLVYSNDADLGISVRLRFTLIPTELDDDATAQGVLVQLGAVF